MRFFPIIGVQKFAKKEKRTKYQSSSFESNLLVSCKLLNIQPAIRPIASPIANASLTNISPPPFYNRKEYNCEKEKRLRSSAISHVGILFEFSFSALQRLPYLFK